MSLFNGWLAKLLLCLVNVMFLFVGLLLFVNVGIQMRMVDKIQYNQLIAGSVCWLTVANIFIIIGLVIGFISIFGFIAAIGESSSLLNIYIYFITLIVLSVGTVALCVSFFSKNVFDLGRSVFEKQMNNSARSLDSMYLVQKVQYSLVCCGSNNPETWSNYTFGNESLVQHNRYPSSCCGEKVLLNFNDTVKTCDADRLIYLDGCFSTMQVYRYEVLSRFVLGVILLSLCLVMILACCLERDNCLRLSKMVNMQYAAHLTNCRQPYSTVAFGSKGGLLGDGGPAGGGGGGGNSTFNLQNRSQINQTFGAGGGGGGGLLLKSSTMQQQPSSTDRQRYIVVSEPMNPSRQNRQLIALPQPPPPPPPSHSIQPAPERRSFINNYQSNKDSIIYGSGIHSNTRYTSAI